LRRLFWKNFFALLLVAIAIAEWVCAAWLLTELGGVEVTPLSHLLGPLLIYALNRALVSRPVPPEGPWRSLRRAYTGLAFTSVFGLLFLLVTGVFWGVAWTGLHAVGLTVGMQVPVAPLSSGARAMATCGLLAVGTAMAYGYSVGQRRLWVNRLDVPMAGISTAMDGLRLIQISDVHLGGLTPTATIAEYVARINALEPDVVVITGDITDGIDHAEETFTTLGGLRARCGVIAILGNHDVYTGSDAVAAALARYTDFTVLLDENARIDTGEGELWFVGLLDRGRDWARGVTECPTFESLWREVPDGAPAVVLTHRPDLFGHAARLGAPLVLAGHTHGGQLAIPWGAGRAVTLARFMTPYPRGTFRINDSLLHVNLGLGVTGQPVRLATPREITVITLRSTRTTEGVNPCTDSSVAA